MPSPPSGASDSAGVPRLPPISTRRRAAARMWPISAVVVDLPPIGCGEIGERDLAGDRIAHRGIVVPGEDRRAGGGERIGGGPARSRETQDRDAATGKAVDDDVRGDGHGRYRN